jgi:hypothetical protein
MVSLLVSSPCGHMTTIAHFLGRFEVGLGFVILERSCGMSYFYMNLSHTSEAYS